MDSREQIVQHIAKVETRRRGPFVCHRSAVSEEPESICAAWYKAYALTVPELRLAEILGCVERVQP